MTFKYWNNKESPHVLIFECQADTILEADKKLKEATGYDAMKLTWIGCTISN